MAQRNGSDRAGFDVPWARRAPAAAVRELVLLGVLGPAMDLYTRRRIVGTEHIEGLEIPVLFVANHSSHMDTPAVLRAMPRRCRRRTAVAAAADYFYSSRPRAYAVALAFNTVPMQRKGGGGLERSLTARLSALLRESWNLLVFAEGTRSRNGRVGRLRSGAAVLAAEHDLPIVPIYVSGTGRAMPPGKRWMHRRPGFRRQAIEIRFGAPIRPTRGEDPAEVMERVRLFFAESGAATTPADPVSAGDDRHVAGHPA